MPLIWGPASLSLINAILLRTLASYEDDQWRVWLLGSVDPGHHSYAITSVVPYILVTALLNTISVQDRHLNKQRY